MAFFEVEFPKAIAYGAKGGPGFSTSINAGFSGFEQRNRNWAQALGRWEVLLYSKPQAYFEQVYNFWLNVGGKADGFRFKDAKDYRAVAQVIGTGDGDNKAFQLSKTYSIAGRGYTKLIKKPITSGVLDFHGNALADTVVVYVGGARQTAGVDYTIDPATGIVTFTTAPALAAIVTADFEFHFPVRFDSDECSAVVEESDVEGGKALITWPGLQLVEVRL